MAATVDGPSGPLRVVATHTQPDSSGSEPSLRQARDIRAFVAAQQAARPAIVVGADFNLEPANPRTVPSLLSDHLPFVVDVRPH